MANADQPQFGSEQYQPQSRNSNKGCLWGCLIAGGLTVAAVLCAGFGLYFFVSEKVGQFSSPTPQELPAVEYTEEEMQALESRIESFRKKLDAGERPEEDLVLSADDINAMINANESLKGKAFVDIENDQVKGKVSIPLDGVPGGSGRYFNGSASFDVSMDGGVLIVTLDQAEVRGEPVPEQFLAPMRQENLAKDIYKDPKNAKFMRQFEEIRIEDNQFILRVKRDGDSTAADDGQAVVGQAGDDEAVDQSADTNATSEEETAPAEDNEAVEETTAGTE